MSIFRKRKSVKKKKKIDEPTAKIYMPQSRNSLSITRVKRKKTFFKKNTGSFSSRKQKKSKIIFSFLFFYLLLPLILLSLLYASVLFVIRMGNSLEEEDTTREYVIGLDGIPIFPGSQFIFTNSIKEMSVANFIEKGNSAYRLPLNTSVSKVFIYYNTALSELGWEHVLSVEIGSEEMIHGEYWVKGEAGLRIYSKFNDVWYESLTNEQAITGLRERIEEEIERDLLLASEEFQDLLPDYPWVIKVPKEYIVSYRVSDYKTYRAVMFRKIGSSETVIITPINRMGLLLDDCLREYVESISSEENNWSVINTILTNTAYATALKGTISNSRETNNVAVVQNTYNKTVYIIDGSAEEESFFDYIFSNLLPANLLEQ